MTVGDAGVLSRARGALLGQLCGDALGSQVEFMSGEDISRAYPCGVRGMEDGGVWGTLAGQPTDDSEMALVLARVLLEKGSYDPDAALRGYKSWLLSGPFDCGNTIARSLRGIPMPDSQANGAMMRASPLGVFGAGRHPDEVALWARKDASLTHPNPLVQEANALYVAAISAAVRDGTGPGELHALVRRLALGWKVSPELLERVELSAESAPGDFKKNSGWVLLAFQNALYRLLHAENFEEGVVATVSSGGDTDTNGAICGALLGAVYGEEAVPKAWRGAVLNCRPRKGAPGVRRPRPECFWPVDAVSIADALAGANP
jgi:ADP-ribosylglycohydrolase